MEKAVLESGSSSPKTATSLARWKQLKQPMARTAGVLSDYFDLPDASPIIQVLDGGQVAATDVFTVHTTPCSAFRLVAEWLP